MSKLTKNYMYNLLYQILVLLTPIITTPYLARTLGAYGQGIASYVVSFSSIISTITLLGIYGYGNRQIAYERDNLQKVSQTFFEIMIIRLILGTIGSLIYFVIIKNKVQYAMYFGVYYVWLLASYLDCTWLYVGLEDMKPAVMKNFFAKLITILGIFIFVRSEDDIWKYILLLGLSVLIANISAYFNLKEYIIKTKINLNNIFKHIKGSIYLFLPTVATLVYLQVDKVMIEVLTNQVNQVSFYDNAEKIVTIPLTFITVLSTVMMPRIANEYSKGNLNQVKQYITKSAEISIFMAMPMFLGLASIAMKFVPWYLGEEFIPVSYAIIFICPIVLSNSLEGVSGKQYFMATNQVDKLMISYISTAVMNLILNLILIPKYGFYGAAIATLISSYTCVIIQFTFLNRQMSMKELLYPILKYFFMATVMAIVIYLISYKMDVSIITTFIQIIIGMIVYFALCFIIKDKIFLEIWDKGLETLKLKN